MILKGDVSTVRAGRPKSEEKRAAIAEAAARLFLTEGFSRTSMDGIASAAGVSKQTVYSHFHSKDELFSNCIAGKVSEYELLLDPADARTLDAGLEAVGDGYLRLLSDDRVVAMWRLVVGESAVHGHVAELFYETGPRATVDSLAAFLEQHGDDLGSADYHAAAMTFMALLTSQLQTEIMLGLKHGIPTAERRQRVADAIRQFRAIYAKAR